MGILTKLSSDNPKQKITVRLPSDLYAETQEAVALGLASSQSDFILESIRRRAREVRHARMRQMAAEAMADPGFVSDMRETVEAFRHVDTDPWLPETADQEPGGTS